VPADQAQNAARAETLYVMQYSFRRDIVKIGRSHDPEKRRLELARGQAYTMELVATFPGRGNLEGKVHEMLAPHRNQDGAGREWFNVTVEDAVLAILALLP
jgi:hypothetical protein